MWGGSASGVEGHFWVFLIHQSINVFNCIGYIAGVLFHYCRAGRHSELLLIITLVVRLLYIGCIGSNQFGWVELH